MVDVAEIGALKSITCDLMLYFLLYGSINVSVDLVVETFNLFAAV